MDPYIEDREIWRGFHHSFPEELKGRLNPLIGPKYYADVEVRIVAEEILVATRGTVIADTAVVDTSSEVPAAVSGPPRAAIAIPEAPVRRLAVMDQVKQRSVRIVRTESGELVTAIEILSPFNKRAGEGIEDYRRKRTRLLGSSVHLIEIDLLRGGERPGREILEPPLDCDYVVLVNRASEGDARTSEIWPVALSEALPVIPVPLLAPDPVVPLDLGEALRTVYERSGYGWRIDYAKPVPSPPLRAKMASWLRGNLPGVGG
jgi:hypothetical protein